MKINCLIVDDEPLASNVIKKYLIDFKEVEVLHTCQDALEAFIYLSNSSYRKVDLLFLDINMPEITGMELIRRLDTKPLTIITTAYREYAVESYELNVFDYLMKPVPYNRFSKTMEKVIEHFALIHKVKNSALLDQEEKEHLFVKVDKKMIKIYFSDILYVESLKDYVRVVCTSENFITHSNLGNFTSNLPDDRFIRIHRSYTISLSSIKSLEGNSVHIGNKIIPIGRNYQVETKKLILNQRIEA
jgi:DNA-binding LytR/AlgR family response regulator